MGALLGCAEECELGRSCESDECREECRAQCDASSLAEEEARNAPLEDDRSRLVAPQPAAVIRSQFVVGFKFSSGFKL